MKRNDFLEIKNLTKKEIVKKVGDLKNEILSLIIDKNTKKLKDLKVISKKRKEVAKMLTLIKQKTLLESLEKGENK